MHEKQTKITEINIVGVKPISWVQFLIQDKALNLMRITSIAESDNIVACGGNTTTSVSCQELFL